ncbi:MAG: EamA family transporter [Verrucomicrobiota bacterium]
MEPWKVYAFLAALFAGLTSILAKAGLKEVHADVGLAVRTAFVFVLISSYFLLSGFSKDLRLLSKPSIAFLFLSAVTTSLSWIFYYRAMKAGTISYVSLIDKGSLLVTIVLSVLIFKEPLTGKTVLGAALMISGILLITWK